MLIKEEKPEYGWYVKDLIGVCSILGLIGLLLLILGVIFQGLWGIILIMSGIAAIFFFLWPGLGLAVLNLHLKDRSQLINNFILINKMEALNKFKSPKILDVGCGTGRTAIKIAKVLKNGGYLTGIDIYEKYAISGNALDTVQRNAKLENVDDKTTFQNGSATDIPFENEKFDIVNVSSVLHEIHDAVQKENAVKEIYRVLKPEGYLYLSEWNRTSWQIIAYAGIFCLAFKKYNYWYELLKRHGFKDVYYENLGGFEIFSAKK